MMASIFPTKQSIWKQLQKLQTPNPQKQRLLHSKAEFLNSLDYTLRKYQV
jgi:hypothetical protein